MFKNIGKSIWKGVKYTGLALGGAGLGAMADAGTVSGVIGTALAGAGVPAVYVAMIAPLVIPALSGVLATATQQVIKHRDKVFAPDNGE